MKLQEIENMRKLHDRYQSLDKDVSEVRNQARQKLIKIYEENFHMKEKDPVIYSYCLEENMNSLYKDEAVYEKVMNRFFSYINICDLSLKDVKRLSYLNLADLHMTLVSFNLDESNS